MTDTRHDFPPIFDEKAATRSNISRGRKLNPLWEAESVIAHIMAASHAHSVHILEVEQKFGWHLD
jgi:hypothetical protein